MAGWKAEGEPLQAGWSPCPPGKFAELSRALRQRRQRRSFLKAAGAVAAGVAVGGVSLAGIAALLGGDSAPASSLTCRQVEELIPALKQDCVCAGVRSQVEAHAAQCCRCQSLLRSHGICSR